MLCLGLYLHLRCVAVLNHLSDPRLQGAAAIAEVLFGDHSPSGRLPVTFCHNNFTQQSLMSSMDMRAWPGRTYRFLQVSAWCLFWCAEQLHIRKIGMQRHVILQVNWPAAAGGDVGLMNPSVEAAA